MVVDERGVFKDDAFQAAVAALQDSNAAAATAQSGKGGSKGDKKQPKKVRMQGDAQQQPGQADSTAKNATLVRSCSLACCLPPPSCCVVLSCAVPSILRTLRRALAVTSSSSS